MAEETEVAASETARAGAVAAAALFAEWAASRASNRAKTFSMNVSLKVVDSAAVVEDRLASDCKRDLSSVRLTEEGGGRLPKEED